MRKRTLVLVVLAALMLIAAGVAIATPPSGFVAQLLSRGNAGEFQIRDKALGLKIRADEPTDVAVVQATLTPGGFTGWHGHPGPSLVIVKSGTITMYQPSRRDDDDDDDDDTVRQNRCRTHTFGPGRAFVHPSTVHNFVNTGTGTAEFYIVYFAPPAAPLLRDEPAPPECP
jgi:quercetin dioxygenase-like cupin family protein